MYRFLIADDSTFMRGMLRELLTKHKYTVIGEAENGRIAVEKYKELRPDMVTLDITMHEMTGIEALQEIIKFDKDAKVFMVSAMGQKAFIQEALDAGAKGFIVKPFVESAVINTIKGAC